MAAMLLELDAILFLESQAQKEVIDALFNRLLSKLALLGKIEDFEADFSSNFEHMSIDIVEKVGEKDAQKSNFNRQVEFRKRSNALGGSILENPIFEGVREKVLEREALSSTCIGSGIAIPHVRIEGLDRFYMVLGIHKEGIDWGAMDGSVVHLILLILGPDVEPIHYLNYLSSLTKHLKNEKLKEKLMGCDTVHEAYEIFTKEDGSWI